jgi:hypothetical protein
VPHGLAGYRLDGRQRVLDAVVELLDQQALQLLGLPSFGDVAGHLRRPDHIAEMIAQRRHCQRHIDATAILGYAYGFVVIDALAQRQVRQDASLVLVQLWRNDQRDRPADRLFRLVAEDAHGASIPRRDDAIERLADDCIVR